MLEISLNGGLTVQVTVILGFESFQRASLVSVFPHFVVAVQLQDAKISAMTRRIVELQQSGGQHDEIQHLVNRREDMMISLSRLACMDLAADIEKWRSRTDTFLTALFAASTMFYLWSIAAGLAIDAVLVALLWSSCRLFSNRISTAQSLIWEVSDARS